MSAGLLDLRRRLVLRELILFFAVILLLVIALPEVPGTFLKICVGLALFAAAVILSIRNVDDALHESIRHVIEIVQRAAGRPVAHLPADAAGAVDALEKTLAEAGTDIGKSKQTSREFLSAISHQMSQPLTALRGTLELAMLKKSSDPAAQRVFQDTLVQADRIVQLTRSLRELAEAEQSWDSTKQTPLSVVLGEVSLDMRPVAASQGVRLEVSGPGEVYVTANPQRIQQAVLYLIGHCIQVSGGGGSVKIELEQSETEAILHIHRTGKPYEPHEMDGLFEPFLHTRGASEEEDQDRVRLAIAKRIIEAAHGNISVDSITTGATFHVNLPRTPGAN
ncbi:MAG: HAMP domain-containing histidine kinase [Acidobacteria bacterium]|nr:HAMP domain-containing histidine kinase [Acidobacteriota bacterium]